MSPLPTPARFSARARRTLLHAAIALAAAAVAPWSHAIESIKIGVVGPFSGPASDFGIAMRRGIELAAEEINAYGGYGGRNIQLLIKDDEAKPDLARQRTQELIDAGVVTVLGYGNTGSALKSMELLQKSQIPMLVAGATGTPITATYPARESYVFRLAASDALQVPFVVNDLAKRGWKRVAIFADNSGYGEAGLKDLRKALADKQLQEVSVHRFDVGVKDLKEAVQEARAAGAQVIFSITLGRENAVIANARQELGWKVPQVGPWTLSFSSYIEGAKGAAEGTMMAQTFIAEPVNERRATFMANYLRKYKLAQMDVPVAAAQGYDALYLLTYSLLRERIPQLTGPAIKQALETNNRAYYGVITTYKNAFTADDKDAFSANMLFMGLVRNGKITFAYPEDATRNAIVQRKKREK